MMFLTYSYAMFANALLKSVKSFAMIFGVMMMSLGLAVALTATNSNEFIGKLIFLIVFYLVVVFVFAKSYYRCSETVVFFKYVNYLVLAVENPVVYRAYNYGNEEERQTMAFMMAKDARKGLNHLIQTINPNVIHFTTHSKVLTILKRQKSLSTYAYEETKQTQKSLALESCVLSSFSTLKAFKQTDFVSFNREMNEKRTFHTGKFVKAN